MKVRIYRPAKTAMQSGVAKTKDWLLESEPAPKQIDPLMGWTSSRDTMQQVPFNVPLTKHVPTRNFPGTSTDSTDKSVRAPEVLTLHSSFTSALGGEL